MRNQNLFMLPIAFDNAFEAFSKSLEEVINDKKLYKNYPPANFYSKEDKYIIELAVPGFEKDEIEIRLSDYNFIVRGCQLSNLSKKENINPEYIGIADREFIKNFSFTHKIKSIEPVLRNGILKLEILFKTEEEEEEYLNINIKEEGN